MSEEKYAIRFGLGAIKAVGLGMMEGVVKERQENGKFKNIYDFAERIDPKSVNKKSIEALAKSGGFDAITNNRRQIFESFEILSSYANEKKEEALSNQMSLFGGSTQESRPKLKDVPDWNKQEKLQREFEAFDFFLNEHPVDDYLDQLRKRGVVFSDKIERDEFEDNNLIKMAGVVASSKHRSGPKGRFAYMTISDPFGIYEVMIFDEEIITNARDLLIDGSMIAVECLVKKDDGGVRILVRDVKKLDDFIKHTEAKKEPFEDIRKQPARRQYKNDREGGGAPNGGGNYGGNKGPQNYQKPKAAPEVNYAEQRNEMLRNKKIFQTVKITIKDRSAIFSLKPLLYSQISPEGFEKITKVILIADGAKPAEVILSQKFLLDESDVARVKRIEGVVGVVTDY